MIDINQEYADMGWDDVIGLSITPVLAEWQGTTLPRVVLFHGPYGCGKNLLAYLFAKKLPNVEITVRNTVDNTAKGAEEMISQFSAPPLLPDVNQVCILNEYTLFRKDAMAKFKDIFQSPPERTYFFVCTNEPEGIIPDIYNRFRLVVGVNKLNEQQSFELTNKLCNKYGLDFVDKKTKLAISKGSGGVPRTIRNVVLVIKAKGEVDVKLISELLDSFLLGNTHKHFMELALSLIFKQNVLSKPPTTALQQVKDIYEKTGLDPTTFKHKLLGMIYKSYMNKVGVKKVIEILLPRLEQGLEKQDLVLRMCDILWQKRG
jgi:DNA polymerase III delta prime subunit